MDSVVVPTRFEAASKVLTIEGDLTKAALSQAFVKGYPSANENDLSFFILVPLGGSFSGKTAEIELTDEEDFAALRSGDLVVGKRTNKTSSGVSRGVRTAAMLAAASSSSPVPSSAPSAPSSGGAGSMASPAARAAAVRARLLEGGASSEGSSASPGGAVSPMTPVLDSSSESSGTPRLPTATSISTSTSTSTGSAAKRKSISVAFQSASAGSEPVARLAALSLSLDEEGKLLLQPAPAPAPAAATASGSGSGSPAVPRAAAAGKGTPGGKKRRLTLADVSSGSGSGVSSVEADAAVAGLAQAAVVKAAGLLSLRVPADAPPAAPHARLLATPGWDAAPTLAVVVPQEGMPPGVWSTRVCLLAGTRDGSMQSLLSALALAGSGSSGSGSGGKASGAAPSKTPSGAGTGLLSPPSAAPSSPSTSSSVGVLLLNPYVNALPDGAGGEAPLQAQATPEAALAYAWDTFIAKAAATNLVFITHGTGSELALSLITDVSRGAAVRTKLRAIAMVEPKLPPKQVIAAAVNADGSGLSRASAGSLRTWLRARAVAWHAELATARAPPAPDRNGNFAVQPEVLGPAPPAFSEDYGCYVQTVRVAVPGTAAYREEAESLVAEFAPTAAAPSIASFLAAMTSTTVATAAAAAAEGGAAPAATAATWAATAVPKDEEAAAAPSAPATPAAPAAAPAAPAAAPAPAASASAAAASTPSKAGSSATATTTAVTGEPTTPAATAPPAPAAAPAVPAAPAAPAAPAGPAGPRFIPPAPVPPEFQSVVSRALARAQMLYMDAYKPGGGSEWKDGGIASGVRTYGMAATASRPADAPADEPFVGGRGDSICPYPVSAVADLLLNDEEARYEMDQQLDKATTLKVLSPQAKIERLAFKGVFPTDPRDFVALSAWEVSEEGTVYMIAGSVELAGAGPQKGFVRGRLDCGAWVLQPLTEAEYARAAPALGLKPIEKGAFIGACRVCFIFRTSIGGAIPKFVVQQVTGAQCKLPSTVTKILDRKYGRGQYAGSKKAKPLPADPLMHNMGSLPDAPAAAPAAAAADGPAPPREAWAEGSAATATATTATTDPAAPAATDAEAAATVITVTDATAETASSSGGGVLLGYGGKPSPRFNISGSGWKLDKGKSDSLDGLLKEMGIPWVARKVADSLDVTTNIKHTPSTLVIEDQSSLGNNTTSLSLDWKPAEIKGQDGKVVTQRAVALAGYDEVDERVSLDEFIERYARDGPPAPPGGGAGTYPAHGPGSGIIVTTSVLPDGLGTTRDVRRLDAPNVLRLSTILIKDGKVKARLTRFQVRTGDPAQAFTPADGASGAAVTAPSTPAPTPATTVKAAPGSEPGTPVRAKAAAPAPAPAPASAVAATAAAAASPAAPGEQLAVAAPAVIVVPPKERSPGSPWSATNWAPNDRVRECMSCKQGFGALHRVHHCRACGGAFCDDCSSHRLPLAHFTPAQLKESKQTADALVRVCNSCAAPAILTFTPAGSAPVPTAGGTVTLTGAMLGDTTLLKAGKIKVTVENTASGSSSSGKAAACTGVKVVAAWTSLQCTIPPGTGSRRVRITVDGRASEAVQFEHALPSLERMTPCDSDGGAITVSGDNLGDGAAARQLVYTLHCGAATLPCAVDAVMAPHKGVQLIVPPIPASLTGAAAAAASLTVTAPGGTLPSARLPVAWAAPAVYAVRSQKRGDGDAAKTVLILSGANFGTDAGAVQVSVQFGSSQTAAAEGVTILLPHSKLQVALPAALAAQHGLSVTVTINGARSAPFPFN